MNTPEREALAEAIKRMDRARNILTDGKPTPMCNWGMLATEDLKAMLAASPAAGGVQALTDEQIDDCMPLGMHAHSVLCGPDEIRRFARRIEARAAPPAAPAQAKPQDEFLRQVREVLAETAAKPGVAVRFPDHIAAEARKFMRGEPSAFAALFASQEGAAK